MTLRVRKARSVTSVRIQSLASVGAAGGLLTPREIKEICQAVVAGAEVLPEDKPIEVRVPKPPSPKPHAPKSHTPTSRRLSRLDASRPKGP